MNTTVVVAVVAGVVGWASWSAANCGKCQAKAPSKGAAACAVSADQKASCPARPCSAAKADVPSIDTADLKKLLDSKAAVVVLDARSGKWDDGRRLPGARSLASDASPEAVAAVVPDKEAQIVTYCSNRKCPASGMLAKNLRGLGYKNVSEYHPGIAGWTEAGNAVENAKR